MMGTYTIMSKCKNEYCDKHFFAMIVIWNSSCIEASVPSTTMILVKENQRNSRSYFIFWTTLSKMILLVFPLSLFRTHTHSSLCTIFYVINCWLDPRPRLPPSSTSNKKEKRYLLTTTITSFCLSIIQLWQVHECFVQFNEMFVSQTDT